VSAPLLSFLAELGRLRFKVKVSRRDVELEQLAHQVAQLTRERDVALESVETSSDANAELVKRAGDLSHDLVKVQKELDESDRKLSAAAADVHRARELQREGREKLVELHTALQTANNEASHGKGPAESDVLEHLEQLNTTIQFLGEGL